jgi:hypothetical protein
MQETVGRIVGTQVIGYWTSHCGVVDVDAGLFLAACGVEVTPVMVYCVE